MLSFFFCIILLKRHRLSKQSREYHTGQPYQWYYASQKGWRKNGRTYILHRWRINLWKIQDIVNISIILGGQELLSKVNDVFLHFSFPSLRRKHHVGRLLRAMEVAYTLFGNTVLSAYQEIQYVLSFDWGPEQESTLQEVQAEVQADLLLKMYYLGHRTLLGCLWWEKILAELLVIPVEKSHNIYFLECLRGLVG